MNLADRVLAGDRLALARLLTSVENGDPSGLQALAALHPHTGRAHLVGITGGPGTGKSTLVNKLVGQLRKENGGSVAPSVAVVAVDPSSPFTGGAILGDRIRMQDLAGDPGVFIRSMASRGALGGLARTTGDLVKTLDAAGFQLILIETVGAGQAEVDIAKTAHTTVVVDAPGLGDEVQAIKAGILEIADVLVVNKADLPGADRAARTLQATLEMAHPSKGRFRNALGEEIPSEGEEQEAVWMPVVLKTVATRGEGIDELIDAIRKHRHHLETTGELYARERNRLRAELEILLRDRLMSDFLARLPDEELESMLERVLAREIAPRKAVNDLVDGTGS